MKIVSFTEARNDLKAVFARRVDYYNNLMDTVHLLRSPNNAEHVNRSIAQYRAGKTTARELIDE